MECHRSMSDINETALLQHEEKQDQLYRERKEAARILSEESWRDDYDVLTEGALGDYPE